MGPARTQDLVQYLAEFGLTLADLTPAQVSMYVAARNAAHLLEGLEIQVGMQSRQQAKEARIERETEALRELTVRYDRSIESPLPADEMDVRQVRSVEDLPRIFPAQWLLEQVQPELFYAKLARQELLMPEWQRAPQRPSEDRETMQDRELLDESAAAENARLHACVLLDTSSSMADHDRRGTVARGLALEFLRKGYEQGARLHLRTFATEVGEPSTGDTWQDFRAVARRVMEVPNSGQTRIQAALEQSVNDIRGEGPCLGAGILLISDGISRLTRNPLDDEQLHSFILGDLLTEATADGAIGILKQWSHTFRRIWTNTFADLLRPTQRDCQAASRWLDALLEKAEANQLETQGSTLGQAVENVRYLAEELHLASGTGKSSRRPSSSDSKSSQTGRATVPSGTSRPTVVDISLLWDYLRRAVVRGWRWLRRKTSATCGRSHTSRR